MKITFQKLLKDRKTLYFVLGIMIVSVFTLSVAYAAMSAVLEIHGNSEVVASNWDIYLDNVRITSGSVTNTSVPQIKSKNSLEFSTILNMPGDFYEFTVDVVNDGSIDAMIDSVIKTPELTTDQAKYIKYEITYENGESISTKQNLKKGTSTPIKVRVEYRKDISVGDLPSSATELNLKFTLVYVQSDGSGNDVLDNGGVSGLYRPETVEQLKSKYEFNYYSTITGAINDVNNGSIGVNSSGDEINAVAGVYVDSGKTYVVLLKDTTTSERITPIKDVTINLNGKTLSGTNLIAIDTADANPVTITVDGRIEGSQIQVIQSGNNQARAIQTRAGSTVNVLGGTYIGESNGGAVNTIYTAASGTVNISNANIYAESPNAEANALSISENSNVNVSNCEITATSTNYQSRGIKNSGKLFVSNSTINAYANITTSFSKFSQGISNYETAELSIENCYVMGTHSGVQNSGILYVDGGTYESYAHGGFYMAGTNTTVYIKNVISREVAMPDGYTHNYTNPNGAGLYVGGAAGFDNNSVYIDNCEFYGSKYPIVLRDSSGEKNNTIYISNSKINSDKKIRIDSTTHKLYIGAGNNFTANNTTLSSAVVVTDEVYNYN